MTRGKLFIFLIFSLALLLTGFALLYRYTQTHEVIDFWGPEGCQSISSPDHVELWQLVPWTDQSTDLPEGSKISIQDRQYIAAKKKSVTKAPGFINASGALILNRNYNWSPREEQSDCMPAWTHALLYRRGKHTTVVAISLNCGWVYSREANRVAGINKSIAEGLARLFQEQLGS
tara:strand:+ start:128 stop:652 length:525 start_codon:yes stop_codon:yes gene_type:complete